MNLKKYLTKKNQSDVDKLDVGKFTTPVNLSKLSGVVKNEVVKKTVYHEVIKKVNAIQTTDASNLVKRSDYDTKKCWNWKENSWSWSWWMCYYTRIYNTLTADNLQQD